MCLRSLLNSGTPELRLICASQLRLTNLAGTAEGLRLDSIEGFHPVVSSDYAFEIRLERVREPLATRFKVRLKNIGDPGCVPIREWIMDRTGSTGRLEETTWDLESADGDFICVENCVPDNNPAFISFSRHVWSTDGTNEATAGRGLDPGGHAAHFRSVDFDTDTDTVGYLTGFQFTVVFADGVTHTFDYDADVSKEIGSLYHKYMYFSSSPQQSWNRPSDYYQFVAGQAPAVPSLSAPSLWMLTLAAVLLGGFLIRRETATQSR